ncbi:hypothetical protein, partial [Mesorhizobium sp.]|uniref:hypothetical protein n=1 Tax=Mesorhizobium sp. TaxID=1871066 RepID=UPI0025C22DE5
MPTASTVPAGLDAGEHRQARRDRVAIRPHQHFEIIDAGGSLSWAGGSLSWAGDRYSVHGELLARTS